jgi:hypothetical protein
MRACSSANAAIAGDEGVPGGVASVVQMACGEESDA